MRRSLSRVLRLRALVEEESRLKLERLAQEAYSIVHIQEMKRSLVSEYRNSIFYLITQGSGHQTQQTNDGLQRQSLHEDWLTVVRDSDLASSCERQLQILAAEAMGRVEVEREQMLQLRTERKQIEILLDHEMALQDIERERNQQRKLDDWYAATCHMKLHRALHSKPEKSLT